MRGGAFLKQGVGGSRACPAYRAADVRGPHGESEGRRKRPTRARRTSTETEKNKLHRAPLPPPPLPPPIISLPVLLLKITPRRGALLGGSPPSTTLVPGTQLII